MFYRKLSDPLADIGKAETFGQRACQVLDYQRTHFLITDVESHCRQRNARELCVEGTMSHAAQNQRPGHPGRSSFVSGDCGATSYAFAALTIARMPAFSASGSLPHAAVTSANSRSAGVG